MGVFGIGLEAYWDQFEGLSDRLEGYQRSAEERMVFAAEGESLPEQMLKIGNTNSRLRFTLPPAAFMNAWCEEDPAHHCAFCHQASTLRKVAPARSRVRLNRKEFGDRWHSTRGF